MSEHIECCPFGCKAGMTVYRSIDCEYVICDRCESTGPAAKTREEAIAAWNKRAQPAGEAVPVAWGAFRVGGDRDGQLYAYGNTRHEIETYITQVHQASDNITLRDAPLYAAPPAAANQAWTWQPIETAPKTGRTLLLGYQNSLGKWRTVRGQWMSDDYIAEYWEDPDEVEAGWFETSAESDDIPNCWRIEPTHWMPLPASPHTESHALGGDGEK